MAPLDRDIWRDVGREIVTFLPDLVVMLHGVVMDPRVPQSAKVEAGAALAYLVSPKNRLTSLIPVVGQLDDVAVVAFAFRRLAVGAGEGLLRDHWRGSDRAFQVLIGASTALATPRGLVRKAKLAQTLAMSTFDRVSHRPSGSRQASGGAAKRPGDGGAAGPRIVDGEVVRPAASSGGTSSGGMSAGSTSAGSTSAGSTSAGSTSAGKASAGKASAGDRTLGGTSFGDTVFRDTVSDRTAGSRVRGNGSLFGGHRLRRSSGSRSR